jgi:RNA polymerase sigma factor (sigma-70 family)
MTQPHELSSDATDAQIMRAARTSNDAFCLLYDRYSERMFRWCARHAEDVAADLTAEIFAQAWISRRSFKDKAGGSAGPWLFGIARNVLRDSVRKRRAETSARKRLGLPTEGSLDLGYESVDDRLSLPESSLAALAALPESQREALDLRIVHELGYEEIARQLGVTPALVRLRVSRALRKLAPRAEGSTL